MNLLRNFRRPPTPTKVTDDAIIGWALHANGRVEAVKQGSGAYGSGFGEGAFSETAFGVNVALSQSVFGWAAAYSVSTWVYRCIEVRKAAIHRMPWAVYDKRTKAKLTDHPLYIALKRNSQKLFKKIEQSQLLYGETFLELATNDYGYRSDLFWFNNLGMAVLVGNGRILGYSYTALQGGQPKTLDVDEVAFMKTDNPFNDLRGMSPMEVAMDEVAIDKDVARVVRAYYANDTRVGLLLIPKMQLLPADAEHFMDMWKLQHQGPNKAGKPALMPYDMSVERVQEPATLDDVQLRESTRREICAVFGVPLSLAGAWDDAKYQSLPEQRKSFYEETVIPQCENIAEFMNSDVMPAVDDSGTAEFKYDFTAILALTEDAQKKNDIYSNRLISGLITRAEARQALGHPVRDVDDVYYIPAGSTVVPADEEALVTPTANTVQDTPQEQQQPQPEPPKPSQLPTPEKPKQLPAQATQPPHKSIAAPQDTPLEELAAWEKKALNNGALKAAGFTCYVLPTDAQVSVRNALKAAGKDANKAAIRAIFAVARDAVAIKHPGHPDQHAHGHRGGGGGGGSHVEDKPAPSQPKPPQPDKPSWEQTLANMTPDQRQRLMQSLGLPQTPAAPSAPKPSAPAQTFQNISPAAAEQRSRAQLGSLSSDERSSVKAYSQNGGYEAINSGLRSGGAISKERQQTVANLDKALAKGSLSENTMLYRGRDTVPSDWRVGTTISDKAYVSTSTDANAAMEFAGADRSGAIMRIHAPAGTKGLHVSAASLYPEESEFLLPRGQKFKIANISKTNGTTYVDMEIVQ